MSQPAEVLQSESKLEEPRNASRTRHTQPGTRHLISGASLVLGGMLVGQAANFAFNAVGAHALGPARYGTLAASMALIGFATPLLAAIQAVSSREATSLAARNELRKLRPMLRHYGLRLLCGALALGAAIAAASGWISDLFHLGSPWFAVMVGVAIPCYTVSHLLGGILQGSERFARFAWESVVEGSAKAVGGVLAMGVLWRSALSGMAAVAASCVVGLLTYVLVTLPLLNRDSLPPIPEQRGASAVDKERRAHRRIPDGAAPGVVRYSVTALVTYGLLAVMLSSDTLVAKHYLPSHQAGLYAGVSLAGKIAYFAASSLFVVAFPVFSRQHDQGTDNRKWIIAAGCAVCATTGAIAIAFALEPAWVVIPLLGDRYQAAEGYVPWMAAVFGLYALGFLVSIYLLARKRRGIIAVLAVALVVQFAGFFSFHSGLTQLMDVLAVAFGVLITGGTFLVLIGGGRDGATPDPATTLMPKPTGSRIHDPRDGRPDSAANPAWPGQPFSWQAIVSEVAQQVGAVPVLLAGSRALGTARADSDYDVVAVLPLLRIPRAAPRLAEASRQLSAVLGRQVSVNPVPRFRMRRPGGSLFVRKLQAEAIVLAAPPGWSLHREPLTGVTKFAASSALLSAVRSLLETFDTSAMRGEYVPAQAGDALRKAALHVAQVRLLRSGCYVSDLEAALSQLITTPSVGRGDTSGADLSAALTEGLAATDSIEGFLRLRECILSQLAEISEKPLSLPTAKSLIRNVQYAMLARLRGRKRWRAALRPTSVEAALAATQLALLRALNPDSMEGFDAALFRLADESFPVLLSARDRLSWEGVRDLALAEWLDAHPLVGVLA